MNTKTSVNQLWEQLRDAIDKTYKAAGRTYKADRNDDERACLRDYARDISRSDNLSALLGREAANERQHRRNRTVQGFSVETAAKLILLNNFVHGAGMAEMPKATAFLVLRQTVVEAEVIGWLCRENLSQEWREAVKAWDYAKLMEQASKGGL